MLSLRGYRDSDRALLRGPWPAGELLGLPSPDRPLLADDAAIAPPTDRSAEVCVVAGTAVVRYADLDWVARRARVEIGVAPDAVATAPAVLAAALRHAFGALNLHRVYGWLSPGLPTAGLLSAHGLQREAVVPGAGWLDGRAFDREIWGVLRERP